MILINVKFKKEIGRVLTTYLTVSLILTKTAGGSSNIIFFICHLNVSVSHQPVGVNEVTVILVIIISIGCLETLATLLRSSVLLAPGLVASLCGHNQSIHILLLQDSRGTLCQPAPWGMSLATIPSWEQGFSTQSDIPDAQLLHTPMLLNNIRFPSVFYSTEDAFHHFNFPLTFGASGSELHCLFFQCKKEKKIHLEK